MLDINITLAIQTLNFFIAVIVLNYLLIRPVREMLKTRKAKMDEMLGAAEKFNTSAAEELAAYQSALNRSRQDAAQLRNAARLEALGEQQTLVGEAGKRAQEHFAATKKAVMQDMESARVALEKQIKPLAAQAAKKILG